MDWPRLAVDRYPFPVYAFDDERRFWVSQDDEPAAATESHDVAGALLA